MKCVMNMFENFKIREFTNGKRKQKLKKEVYVMYNEK